MYTSIAHYGLSHAVVRVVGGATLIALSAQLCIPLQPVPIVMTTLSIMLIGLFYTRKAAVQTVLTYLGAGAVGLPVFSSYSSGLAVLTGPRGGYFIGMLCAVYVMTTFRQIFKQESFALTLINTLLGSATIYMFGVPWLAYLIGFEKAIQFGFMPFLIPGCVKALLLNGLIQAGKKSFELMGRDERDSTGR